MFFLHQTTTLWYMSFIFVHCILCSFYIKPQLMSPYYFIFYIVSYVLSTSNHNLMSNGNVSSILYLMFFLHQTTTHEHHQFLNFNCILCSFYIKPQLERKSKPFKIHCILCSFYIKPQLLHRQEHCKPIVSYVLSTSNHNSMSKAMEFSLLYLMFFLHQTTTNGKVMKQ